MKIRYCGKIYNTNSACKICGKEFYCPPSRKAVGCGQFCSNKCKGSFKKGKVDENLTYKFPKGNTPWNKNKGRAVINCIQCNKLISVLKTQGTKFCSKKCASENLRQRVQNPSYSTIHDRIRKDYGTPSLCEFCGTTQSKKFEWANLSGEYKHDRADWMRLCCVCHRRLDFGVKKKIYLLEKQGDNNIYR
jgi:hypothetical protein